MKFYRGHSTNDFKVEKHINSRYGFPALFFTTEIQIARLYAQFLAKESRLLHKGYIYNFEFNKYAFKYNFNSEISHSSHFRNLIYKLYRDGHKVVIIEDVYDYPSKDFKLLIKQDILVVFDLNLIDKLFLEDYNNKKFDILGYEDVIIHK